MHPLPLAEIDGVKARPCLRSGYCCKQGVCSFGEWDTEKNQCKYLEGDEPGKHSCGIYEEIVTSLPETKWHFSPAFGAGCCSPFNGDRMRLIEKELYQNEPV